MEDDQLWLSQRSSILLSAAQSFCHSFAAKRPLDEIMDHFSQRRANEVVAHRHGLKQLAPYIGRLFTGSGAVREYFEILADCVSFVDMEFTEFLVDAHNNKVHVRGEAIFKWNKGQCQSWDENFMYVITYDHDNTILRYEVWADTGAAYLAGNDILEEEPPL